MASSLLIPWWLDHIGIPVIFTAVGTTLGFATGRFKDWLDARTIKRSFLVAIRGEVLTIRKHLEGTLKDATEVKDSIHAGQRKALHLTTFFQTGVYSSQLPKLRDVTDPIVLETIRFYDRLANLERIKIRATELSYDLTILPRSNEGMLKADPIAGQYLSSLDEVMKRISQLLPAADALTGKLPH